MIPKNYDLNLLLTQLGSLREVVPPTLTRKPRLLTNADMLGYFKNNPLDKILKDINNNQYEKHFRNGKEKQSFIDWKKRLYHE